MCIRDRDTALTKELVEEGVERELISKIQTMRKDAGFEVTDRIRVFYRADGNVAAVLKSRGGAIAKIVLADELCEGEAEGFTKEWELNGAKDVYKRQPLPRMANDFSDPF